MSKLGIAAFRAQEHFFALRDHELAAAKEVLALGDTMHFVRVFEEPDLRRFLAKTGIPERTAHQALALDSKALPPQAVVELGGIAEAALWASELSLPMPGTGLLIASGSDLDGEGRRFNVQVRPADGGWRIERVSRARARGRAPVQTAGPRYTIHREAQVWEWAWELLGVSGAGFRSVHTCVFKIEASRAVRRARRAA